MIRRTKNKSTSQLSSKDFTNMSLSQILSNQSQAETVEEIHFVKVRTNNKQT